MPHVEKRKGIRKKGKMKKRNRKIGWKKEVGLWGRSEKKRNREEERDGRGRERERERASSEGRRKGKKKKRGVEESMAAIKYFQ